MRTCADRIPEEDLLTEQAWGMILNEMLYYCQPFLDIETEVAFKKLFYASDRDKSELFSVYLTKKLNLRRDFNQLLGAEEHTCKFCHNKSSRQRDIPDELWSYKLNRGAKLSDEQRKLRHQWDTGPPSGAKMQ
eukprot:3962255-Karenia_brevis.AAC.1